MLATAAGALSAGSLSAAPIDLAAFEADLVQRTDAGLDAWMANQNTDSQSPRYGGYADANGFYNGGSVSNVFDPMTACYLNPKSKHHRSPVILERLRMCETFLRRHQSPEGNIDLWITNFNSPPDTAFAVHSAARAMLLARRHKETALIALMEPFLKRATPALLNGGVHTPNHRWEMCAALASLNELYPNPALVRRIDQWLAEGIDIDTDDQYTERSSIVYNSVVNQALTLVALKLNRPALLDPVRRNINGVLYLLHGSPSQTYEVETGISRRQDLNTRGGLGRYWHPLAVLAQRDNNPVFRTLAQHYSHTGVTLTQFMLEPELIRQDGPLKPVPDNYERMFPRMGVARIRRGLRSATIFTKEHSTFFSLRHGDTVINAVRFASGFFGKGQFVPTQFVKRGNAYVMTQNLEGPYYQPFAPGRRIDMRYDETREQRPKSQISKLTQSAEVVETKNGFSLRLRASGTKDVPLTVAINCREDVKIEGAELVSPNVYKPMNAPIRISQGGHTIRVSGAVHSHNWYDVRGAEPHLPGPNIFLTGLTPFDVTLDFDLS